MSVTGIDLAAEPDKTAVAQLDWTSTGAIVRELILGAEDDALIAALHGTDKAGIDCPLGWPTPFVAFMSNHHAAHASDAAAIQGRDGRRRLLWRTTDEMVRARTGLTPLSVAADRIGHVAVRCAGLQARLAQAGEPVDRAGTGTLVEVYPAGSLRLWGLSYKRYKGTKNVASLSAGIDALLEAAPWLDLGAFESLCRTRDDAFDAVIAALTARATALGLTTPPADDQREQARTEGWIALPAAPLSDLL